MKLENKTLYLTKDELTNIIKNDNPQKNDWARDKLLKMIADYTFFTDSQIKWLLSKIMFITNYNKKYINIKKQFNRLVID